MVFFKWGYMSYFKIAVMQAALFVFGTATFAQQTTNLDSLSTQNAVQAWRAVGKIQMPRGSYCSSALIAPDLVLTAAHCVYDDHNQEFFDPSDIIFRAGLTNGVAFAERRGLRHVSHPNYDHENYQVGYDVAILQLESPISVFEISPYTIGEMGPVGSSVSVVSYGRGRENVLSKQAVCTLVEHYPNYQKYMFTCETVPGTSGSPIFDMSWNTPRIVSVISGYTNNSEYSTGTTGLPQLVATMKSALRSGRGVVEASGAQPEAPSRVTVRPGGNNPMPGRSQSVRPPGQ